MSRVFIRAGNYWIDFNDAQGVRHRKKIGPDKRVAREVLKDLLGKVARHQYLGIIEDSPISFADFCAEWLKRIGPTVRLRTKERWSGIVDDHLKKAFPMALRSITAADAQRYISRRLDDGVAPSTINREMTVLKHMLSRAVSWGYRS